MPGRDLSAAGTTPVRWLAAYGGPVGRGRLRARPEHFHVVEELGFEPDGEGEHLLLKVHKEGANTIWVARALAKLAGVADREVGYSGLKDRNAIAEQFFTVPVRRGCDVQAWRDVAGEGFRVLDCVPTRRKLRRGAHRANWFRITITELDADRTRLEDRLAALAVQGAPNYFGPQRFGRDGANLELALRWFSGGKPPRGRAERSFALSAARSAIFNAVLAARVAAGTWNHLEAGDVANLDGTRSIFGVDDWDADIDRRCRELDLHPTGPLWGRGDPPVRQAPALIEREIAERDALLAQGLAGAGLEQERRALRVRVGALKWSLDRDQLIVEFRLVRGAFATAVIGELVEWHDAGSFDFD
jgi:tRNA pseudouridine13 synthase